MIYTVTFNPSLDYIVSVEDFKLGVTNRTDSEMLLPGGKGINVSCVLRNLGIDSIALGFKAGSIGDEIECRLKEMNVKTDFIKVSKGVSRINVKLSNIEGTEINGSGPIIDQDEMVKLYEKLDELKAGDVLILAGSIPNSIPSNVYSTIMVKLADRDIDIVVDATKELLVNVLEYHPFLVKPNNHELGEIFKTKLTTRDEVVPYGKKLQQMGARNVLISMAGEGAVLINEQGEVFESKAPKGTLVNGVGAGDSMVAGFISGWLERKDYQYAFRMGVSAGSASAFSKFLATKEEIEEVYQQLEEE